MILRGEAKIFGGMQSLRKICNHPDLYTKQYCTLKENSFGDTQRSGKFMVLHSLLKMWLQREQTKVLIFTQSVKIKDIIAYKLLPEISDKVKCITIDGGTPIKTRQKLVEEFNNDANLFACISTTKVGGLGVNLTAANRVVIFDPDWNPSADAQAQERSFRIGQNRNVVIYRLLTAGTIEEKIYHRQIQKTFLATKILEDPRQKRLFSSTSLKDLFKLGEQYTKAESSKVLQDTKAEHSKPGKLEETVAKARMKFHKRKNIDGGEIGFVEKKGRYKIQVDDNDQDILTTLLANSNVKTAFDHDKVIKNSKTDEFVVLESEAQKKAEAAWKKVKSSLKNTLPGIPTDTGNNNSESLELLKAIKARNLIDTEASTVETDFMGRLRDWLMSGVKASDEVVMEIRTWKNSSKISPAFVKASLEILAVQDDNKYWQLKPKYNKPKSN